MGKREADKVASCGDSHVLHSIDRVTHRRCADALTRIELPKSTASSRFNSLEASGIIREKYQIACCSERATPRVSVADLRIAPNNLSFRHGVCQQNLLRVVISRLLRASTVVGFARSKRLRTGEEDAATLQRHDIEESGVGIVRRRKPIRGAVDARTNVGA